MITKDLQNGDIIAVSGTSFLAKSIQKFMKIYARKTYGVDPWIAYNHTMTVVSTTVGNILVAEAIGRGFVIRNISDALDWDAYKYYPLVFRPVDPFTSVELYRLRKQALNFAFKNIEYEITNFIWWVLYILSNRKIDLAPKNSEKKLFCFETSALLWNSARVGFFKDASKVTTVDMNMIDTIKAEYLTLNEEYKDTTDFENYWS